MNIKEMRELYKELYFHEIKEQKSIEARIRLALSIFAFITSASFFWVEKILLSIVNPAVILDTLSLSAITFSLSNFVYLCYCTYRGLVGWKYYVIPLTKLGRYRDKLKQRYGKYRGEYGKQKVESMIKEAFEEKVVEWFTKCAEHSQGINHCRANPSLPMLSRLCIVLQNVTPPVAIRGRRRFSFALVLLYFSFLH